MDLFGKKSFASRIFPPLSWGKTYSVNGFKSDLSAGVTTAVMLIPQGMAYAAIADLPLEYGLYASIIPLVIYALFGTSRQLSMGPIALASLILGAGLDDLISSGQYTAADRETLVLMITFLSGVIQTILSLLRLGGLVNLLSHPVVSGFTAAAALAIGASQLHHVVGFPIDSKLGVIGKAHYMLTEFASVNIPTLTVTISALFVLRLLNQFKPNWPNALIVVVGGIAAAYYLKLVDVGVSIVGEIPSELPTFEIPQMLNKVIEGDGGFWGLVERSMPLVEQLGPLSLTLALIAFMESISAAKVYARQNGYAISPTQELWSSGLSNVGSSLFGGYIVGGALSRTAVNAKSGAKSPIANIVTAGIVSVAVVLFTPVLAFLPKAILAAIILNAVAGLIDFEEVVHLWHVKKDDLVILAITFLSTLLIGIDAGILIGIGVSLLWLVFTTTRPNVTTLGLLPNTRSYRSVAHFDEAVTFERILVLRMEAQFFFGNVVYLKDSLYNRLGGMKEPCALVLDASSINALDSTAVDTLMEIIQTLRQQGVEVMMSHVKGSVLEVMTKSGITKELGTGHLFYEVEDAVDAALRHRDAVEAGIPSEEESFGPSDAID